MGELKTWYSQNKYKIFFKKKKAKKKQPPKVSSITSYTTAQSKYNYTRKYYAAIKKLTRYILMIWNIIKF